MPGDMSDLDAMLADLGFDGGNNNTNKANTGAKKNKNGSKASKPLIVTHYEGYTVRPLAPQPGEKKTWARVDKEKMPFDSAKLYDMATEYKRKIGKGPASQWRDLNSNQQGLVTRILEQKQLKEHDPDAVWELFHARPDQKRTSKGVFRDEYSTVLIELIVCRKDRRDSKYVDKPAGTTTMPQRVQGEIIDLNVPMSVKLDTKKDKKTKNHDDHDLSADEILGMFSVENKHAHGGKQGQATAHQIPQNPDPSRYIWNGSFYEEIEQQALPYPDERIRWDQQQWQNDPHHAQQQQPYHQPQVPPPAPMPTQHQNPFQPYGTHPEQYADLPTNMDARAQYNQPQQRHSRSRSRSRSHQRRRSRRHSYIYPPSMSSSEADHYSDITPPSTPPNEEWMHSAGHFHRRKSQRYYREEGGRYPAGRIELRPAISYRNEYVEERAPTTRRSILIHDDYPRSSRRRIADYAANNDDAEFRRPQQRNRGVDLLKEDSRRGRLDDVHFAPRRYDY